MKGIFVRRKGRDVRRKGRDLCYKNLTLTTGWIHCWIRKVHGEAALRFKLFHFHTHQVLYVDILTTGSTI